MVAWSVSRHNLQKLMKNDYDNVELHLSQFQRKKLTIALQNFVILRSGRGGVVWRRGGDWRGRG